MDQHTENNIRRIYTNHLESSILDQFISHLDSFFNTNRNILLPIKTIGAGGNLLNYFSVFHISHPEDIVLFAGAVDSDEHGRQFPILRLDSRNPNFALVARFTFPYRKTEQQSNTINMKLLPGTINFVPTLLESQLTWFTQQYVN
ncbi:MAG: hypothetical protein ABSD46_13560 [Bacteroidota bacterium]